MLCFLASGKDFSNKKTEKCWFVAGICLISKLMQYDNYLRTNASIANFRISSTNWSHRKFSLEKLQLKWFVPTFFWEKYMSKINAKEKTKTKSIKSKLLKTLNMNQFKSSWFWFEVRNSRVMKLSYEIEFLKMNSHFQLLIRKFLWKFFFRFSNSTS